LLEVTLRRNASRRKASVKPDPKKFHINKRAAALLAAIDGRDDDELLTTAELANLSGMSVIWLKKRRYAGNGPPYKKVGTRGVRYTIGGYRRWLEECDSQFTDAFNRSRERAAGRSRAAARERGREVMA
jgi:hypothetical protein